MSYVVRTTSSSIPIDTDEVKKAVIALTKKSIAVFRRGIVSGAFIISVEEDYNRKRGFNQGFTGERERPSFSPDKQLPDLFGPMRKELEKVEAPETTGILKLKQLP